MELRRKVKMRTSLELMILICMQLFVCQMISMDQSVNETIDVVLLRSSHTDCGANCATVHESQIHLVLYHLIEPLKNRTCELERSRSKKFTLSGLVFEQFNYDVSLEELKLSELNPRLPFKIFINGFNHRKLIK